MVYIRHPGNYSWYWFRRCFSGNQLHNQLKQAGKVFSGAEVQFIAMHFTKYVICTKTERKTSNYINCLNYLFTFMCHGQGKRSSARPAQNFTLFNFQILQ